MMTLERTKTRALEPLSPVSSIEGGTSPIADMTAALSRPERRAQFEREALVHLDALYSFALKLTRARDDAEDLVSDTILRAFDRWEQYQLGTNVRAWLFTILYHTFVSRKRRIDAREVQLPEESERAGRPTRPWASRTRGEVLRLVHRRGSEARDRQAAEDYRTAVC